MLVHVAADNDVKPAIASQSNEARQAFAREVLDCLVSSGAVQLPEGATLKRDDEETIDAEAVRHVEFPEVVNPARPSTRDALLASANVTPVERALKPAKLTASLLRADSPVEDRVRAVVANLGGFSCDAQQYQQLRIKLLQHADNFPDERNDVDATIATLDRRFANS